MLEFFLELMRDSLICNEKKRSVQKKKIDAHKRASPQNITTQRMHTPTQRNNLLISAYEQIAVS